MAVENSLNFFVIVYIYIYIYILNVKTNMGKQNFN